MERIWNIIYIFVYRLDYKLHLLFNYINPFRWIYFIPVVKRFYVKRGIDILKEGEKAFKNPDFGLSSMRAGGFMGILIFLICLGVTSLFSGIFELGPYLKLYHFIIFSIIGILANQILLFRKKKYLKYFKEIESMPKEMKEKWAWISFLVVLVILFFGIGSFIFMLNRL